MHSGQHDVPPPSDGGTSKPVGTVYSISQNSKTTIVPKDSKSKIKSCDGLGIETD